MLASDWALEISRSRFKQSRNSMLISLIDVMGCFGNFWVIFGVRLGGDSFSQRICKKLEK